ncbi:XdhC family protein [Coralliovum pocilloporae]|uniref:XdhC family protein n=1 Tax=Coralliovum pocilloporae TaxID=3066369 RepID=UPI003306E77A
MSAPIDILDHISDLKAAGETFAVATVIRTVSVTAAKAGAKAVIRADGHISGGWIGGGCAKGAVVKAAKEILKSGTPRVIALQPEDLLKEQGVVTGEEQDGIHYARNMCPSQGSMDIFIEPVLPRPALFIYGASPVAVALNTLARSMGFDCIVCAPADLHAGFDMMNQPVDGFAIEGRFRADAFAIISTQGNGDALALKEALAYPWQHIAFVGSSKKMAALRDKLSADGVAASALDQVRAPAGLDLGAITPEEIALSILAEITRVRRRGIKHGGEVQ